MLRYLIDPANAITMFGLICSSVALCFALDRRLDLAVAAGLWAVLADHLDGVVASYTRNREPDIAKMGKSLDGFGDIIYGAILPAVIVVQLNNVSRLSFFIAILLLLTGTIRLSYFANFGKSSEGRFLGVPLSYDIPLLAALLLFRPLLQPDGFVPIVDVAFIALGIAHVASVRVPSPNKVMYLLITVFAIAASAILLHRGAF
ncbi:MULTISPECIES: CDP-alcohol phosphatidyltransferase family protein [unclassified Sinorhizobium]|uniref:CDP-alcohol phosphatidyltransferase family protein n=1 Tax=unclassified Sinorhizobium TaxID=2613772 RepID=UPI0024C3450A|nr:MULTISPECIES: CDP-alcohol phosphatidyltransferase family protein [unclassified Sinorhizobium]MDK1378134.1 CDP-alcohol phosphatidyltransferase family protein [Sinorhizobium sp. 6-70]MDK1482332.1 CDP-alcohol phosphatidyltransferase family protein [Sinorhizobium sp. 6-117]